MHNGAWVRLLAEERARRVLGPWCLTRGAVVTLPVPRFEKSVAVFMSTETFCKGGSHFASHGLGAVAPSVRVSLVVGRLSFFPGPNLKEISL